MLSQKHILFAEPARPPGNAHWAIVRALALIALVAFTSSCSDQPVVAPVSGETAKWLTGDAARSLDPNGHFILSGPPIEELGDLQARSLAAAYLRVGARWLANTWQQDRGGEIDFDHLRLCPRGYYARSAFNIGSTGSRSAREFIGPKWLFSACTPGGVQVVSIAVSALATELSATKDRIDGPGGGQFTSAGIPTSLSAAPISPEEAARIAAVGTGKLVTQVPELILPPPPYPPQLAKWRIRLNGPVTLVGRVTGSRLSTTDVYVGFANTWRSVEIQFGTGLAAGRLFQDAEAKRAPFTLGGVADHPTHFERATVERP